MAKQTDTTFSLMFELGRLIKSRMQPGTHLTLPQLETLHFVAGASGCPTMRALAAHLKIKAPSATALADELVRLGCLSRASGARDRRQIELSLTPLGERTLKKSIERRKQVIRALLEPLSKKDRAEFDRILQIIVSNNR